MESGTDFESLVDRYYRPLYRFAFSLSRDETEACDLTQETFHIWAKKGHQLRDITKVKSWLFTTLHRVYLEKRRRLVRFEHYELSQVDRELPTISPDALRRLEAAHVLSALGKLDESFRSPVALCYLEDYSYKEIAEILDIPLGTVKSRISRGIVQLQSALLNDKTAVEITTKHQNG